MKINVPINDTGIVTSGIKVILADARNKYTTIITKINASKIVKNTDLTEALTGIDAS
ncbi:hypothetical protein RiCNE_11200 [Rickettsia endosymbiont of Culicoides newsteadi]|nr:hypothetical protein RiCNE_11200 [Rickettsia endosymbiont of Culicoides newsteadi]